MVAAFVAVAASICLGPANVAADGGSDWAGYLHDASHGSYNAGASAITPAGVSNLQPVWRWTPAAAANGGSPKLQASPTVVNGIVYFGDGDGRFYALRESDRTLLWTHFLGVYRSTTCPGNLGIVSTATVVPRPSGGALTVYVNAPDGFVYAFDAATGAVLWKTQIDAPSATVNDYFAWASPVVANGKVYVGISSDCDQPLVDGGVVALDQSSGAQLGRWHAMLNGSPGASVWSTPLVLADGSVVATTGNDETVAQTPWADSIVRLSAGSLSLLDGWQIPAIPAAGDSDFGGSPTAFTAVLNGVSTPMVGACNKNGVYYALRQADLHDGPVWSTRLGQPVDPGAGQCLAAAIWDGSRLIAAGGDDTTIGGATFDGSVESLDPATGSIRWKTGLPGAVVGSPTEDGAGVIAVPVFSGSYGVYLLSAADGSLLGAIPTSGPVFAQPVFANGDLLVAGSVGLTAYDVAAPGPSLTSVSPSSVGHGHAVAATITGLGFTGSPTVVVSGLGVTTSSVHVVSGTQLDVTFNAAANAAFGPRDVTVLEPGPIADRCSACLSVLPASTTSISSSSNPAVAGQPVTFTAVVSPSDGGGTVAFSSGNLLAGCASVPLSPVGGGEQATCTTSSLPIGTRGVTATYSGDGAYATSTATLSGGQVVQAPSPPAAPAGLQVQMLGTTSLRLTWDGVAGVTKYRLFRAPSPGGPYTLVATIVAPATSRTLTGLTPGTGYSFVVKANAGYADSAPSSVASTTMPTAPASPGHLAASASSTSAIVLTWDAVAGATKYIVYEARDSDGPFSQVAVVAAPGTRRPVTALATHTTYYFVVKASNAYAVSGASNTASATTR